MIYNKYILGLIIVFTLTACQTTGKTKWEPITGNTTTSFQYVNSICSSAGDTAGQQAIANLPQKDCSGGGFEGGFACSFQQKLDVGQKKRDAFRNSYNSCMINQGWIMTQQN